MSEAAGSRVPWTPSNFLALPPDQCELENSGAVLIPVPYDSTASFRGGAGEGPAAMIQASGALEDYDLELDLDVSQIGIHTAPFLEPHLGSPELMVQRVRQAVATYLRPDRVVGVLGGEHSITAGAVQAHLDQDPELSVLYLDAHADLRDEYMGTQWGHASGARRIHAWCPLVLVGVRSICEEERDYLNSCQVEPQRVRHGGSGRSQPGSAMGAQSNAPASPVISTFFWPNNDENSLTTEVISRLGDRVYVSVDLDVFDPSVMAAVGTPEPGGMSWNQVTGLLRAVAESRRIVGFDVCELAPREGPVACTYTAAKLVYKLIAYASRPSDSLNRFRK